MQQWRTALEVIFLILPICKLLQAGARPFMK